MLIARDLLALGAACRSPMPQLPKEHPGLSPVIQAIGRFDQVAFFADTLLVALVRFACTALLARELGPRLAGPHFWALALESVVGTITMASLGAAFMSTAPAWTPGDRASMARVVIRRGWLAGIVAGLTGVIAGLIPAVGLGPVSGACLGVAMLLGTVANAYRGIAVGSFCCRVMLVASVPWVAAMLVGAAIYLQWSLDPVATFWASMAIGQGAFVLVMSLALPREIAGPQEVSSHSDRASAAPLALQREYDMMSRHMLAVGAFNALGSRAQPMLIGAVAPIALGMVGAAMALAGPLRLIGGVIAGGLQPRVARERGTGQVAALSTLCAVAGLLTSGTVLATVCVNAVGESVGRWLLTDLFEGIGRPLAAATLIVGLEAVGLILAAGAQALGPTSTARALGRRMVCTLLMPPAVWLGLQLGGDETALGAATGALLALAFVEGLFAISLIGLVRKHPPSDRAT